MQTSKLDNAKGVPFLNRRYIKGVPFLPKNGIYFKSIKGLDLRAEPPSIKLCWVPTPG